MADLYPITIILDRYNGTYSGGKWMAFNCYPWQIPEDIFNDDESCCEFWFSKKKYIRYGTGNSIDEAVENLKKYGGNDNVKS